MANTNKITKRTVINAMLADENIKDNEMYVNYLTHELELLDKKSASRKPTKTQEKNKELITIIGEVLGGVEKATVSEIMGLDARLSTENGISNQKVSALLRIMIADGTVVKTTEKGRAYFSVA